MSLTVRCEKTRCHADLRVAIVFSECIGDLSRAGVMVQRPGNRNLGSQEYQLTFNGKCTTI